MNLSVQHSVDAVEGTYILEAEEGRKHLRNPITLGRQVRR